MNSSEEKRIDNLTTEESVDELMMITRRGFPRDKVRLLTQLLTLTENCDHANSAVAVEKLRTFIKGRLIMENIKSQVAMYGEPVLTVEKVIEQVESDKRYLYPVDLSDMDVIKTFFKGHLIKAGQGTSLRRDRCLEVILDRLSESPKEVETVEEKSSTYINFEELKLPDRFKKYFSMVDLMMSYTMVCLLEYCKKEPSKEITGPAIPCYDAEKCEEPAVKWLRHEIQARLGLMCTQRYNVYVQHSSGRVIRQPTLYFRDNVIDRRRKTLCLLGWVSDFRSESPQLPFDKIYTPKRFYSRHVHDMKAPLIAYLTAIKLIKAKHQKFPFNLKIVLFPFRQREEMSMKETLMDNQEFLEKVDYFILMNGLDCLTPSPVIVSSALGERVYSLAVYVPRRHDIIQQDDNQIWERLRIILLEMMDLIRQYKYFVKHRKTSEKVETTPDVFFTGVEFGVPERVKDAVEVNHETLKMSGWETKVTLKTFTLDRYLTASITEDDINHIQKQLRSNDPLLNDLYIQLKLVSWCGDWIAGNEYSEELVPIVKLAVLRGSDSKIIREERARSVLPVPVLIQKLVKKDTLAVSFGGIEEFGHHAISFIQVKEAIKIAVCLIMGLKLDGKALTGKEIKSRTTDVWDVTAVAEIPISSHIESPFYVTEPGIVRIFEEFLEALKPKPKTRPPRVSLAPPFEGDSSQAGMVAKYFSKEQSDWILIKYPYTEKIQAQRKYLKEAKAILRRKGLSKERDIAYSMAIFLRFLFFKKRRSDVLCKNCRVYEIRLPGFPLLSALGKGSETAGNGSLVTSYTEPRWVTLQGDSDPKYKLVDDEGFISYRGFMKLVKDLIFNIVFDGESISPVENLYKIILSEQRTCKNSAMVDAIANTVIRQRPAIPDAMVTDKNVLKHPSYLRIIPRHEYNFKKLYNCAFVEDIVSFDEIKYYVLLDSLQKFLIKNRTTALSPCESSESFMSVKSMSIQQIQVDEDVKLDESIYKMIDRTLIEKLLKNECVILPPARTSVTITSEEKLPYWRSENWYKIYKYLMNKSKRGIDMFNDMWDLYKYKLQKLKPGEPIRWIFPSEFGDSNETFDTETLYYLKRYIKYSISILEHFVRLNYFLDDLALIYSVKPKFLNYEAYFILRDSLPVPSLPPKAPPELIQSSKSIKRGKSLLRGATSKDSLKRPDEIKVQDENEEESDSFHNVWGNFQTLFSSKEVQAQAKKFLSPQQDPKRSSAMEADRRRSHVSVSFKPDVRATSDMKSYVKLRKAFKLLLETHDDLLAYMAETKECWNNGSINFLREFEEILLSNIYYWKQFQLIEDSKKYYLCGNIYAKVEKIVRRVSEGNGKPPCGLDSECPLKDYILAEKQDKLLPYLRKQRHRSYAIHTYLSEQNSKLCQRPRDYYNKLTQIYTAIINMVKTITLLQDRFPEVLSLDWIEIIRTNFHFIPDVTGI